MFLALVVAACSAVPVVPGVGSAGRPSSMAELSVYGGADRQQILEEGARKEGSLMLYTSSVDTARRPVTDAFVKRYPFIKVDVFRASNEELVPRMLEEFKANRNTFDVLETTSDSLEPVIAQDVRVQKISGRALADLVIAGEVPLSPTIFDSHVAASKQQQAPIDWVPLEPTVVNLGVAGVAAKGPHPNAALLFADFLLSQEGQKIYADNGYGSARNGMTAAATEFKKRYLENDVPDYIDAFDKWQKLMNSAFIQG